MDQSTNNTIGEPNPVLGTEGIGPIDSYAATPPKKFNRDAIRAAVLDAKSEDELVTAFGVQIEIKAPDLQGLLQYRNAQNDDTVMARSIIDTCYVPGTNEKVFDETDIAGLMSSKFSQEMKKLIKAINRVLGGEEEITAKIDEAKFPDTE